MKTSVHSWSIILPVTLACLVMGLVDAIIQPGYATKSIIKILLFLGMPILHARLSPSGYDLARLCSIKRKGLVTALLAGLAVYLLILGSFFVFRRVFDFSALTQNLTAGTGVNRENFPLVALYISFANSFLEEFFFRGFAFLLLKQYTSCRMAACFSGAAFALYHLAMMWGWFALPVILLALMGLFIGGLLFNWCSAKSGSILLSWLIHMCANFATNTIGLILFAISPS